MMAWFHGRGNSGQKHPVVTALYAGSWTRNQMTIYGGTLSNPDKLDVTLYDNNVLRGRCVSDHEIDYDRWTHLAVTFDGVNSKIDIVN